MRAVCILRSKGRSMEDLKDFEQYMAHLSEGLGHSDRHAGLRGYTTGLMSPLPSRSVEPMAAHMDPLNVRSRHQSLHHFVADANGSDERMLLGICQWVVPLMDFSDGGWWIIDDTGFPKQGRHSVGVARQYCGMLGKQDNCQVAVSVSLACAAASIPVAWQLYLPQEWADDPPRREKAGVPERSSSPPSLRSRCSRSNTCWPRAPEALRVGDAGYGVETAFRERLSELGLPYVVGVTGSVRCGRPGEPCRPGPTAARAPSPRLRRGGASAPEHRPRTVKDVAFDIDPDDWEEITWREGTNAGLRSHFARLRVRAAHRDERRSELRAPQWLLIEWPEGHDEPLKYWLSTLPEDTPLQRMVYEAKMRWRIERDYQDLNKTWVSGSMKGGAGAAFIITPASASPPTASCWRSGCSTPTRSGVKKTPLARSLPYPRITNLGEAQRAQRHVPSSITSLRLRIGALLARNLPRCPCCLRFQRE